MILLRFILRHARKVTLVTGAAALLSGACAAGLIALVNVVLNQEGAVQGRLFWAFIGLGLGKLATHFVSQLLLARFSQGALARLRRDLMDKILAVPLRQLEELGAPRLMVALTDDLLMVTQALLYIPTTAVNLAIVFGGALYLGWLSWQVLAGMLLFILLGATGHRALITSGFRHVRLARDAEDRLFQHFRALTEGIKELKLHRHRRGHFIGGEVRATTELHQRHNVIAETRFIVAQSWGHLLFFALVGMLLFALPSLQAVSPKVLTGYIVTTLYLMGPLAGLLGSVSAFGRANVALKKIEDLGVSLTAASPETCPLGGERPPDRFDSVELIDVTRSYHAEKDDSHFLLGPMTLTFQPGEVTFIVGGNGSGKSTLAKIITGLYPPESGRILLNGQPVTDQNRDDYRQNFSAVFSDFYLFESLLGLEHPDLDEQAGEYLSLLQLDRKVRVRQGVISTTRLSQGQRKRLALLTAYLEDRPFYLFDEWASDQDPQFKEVFYRQLLPELKARGKAVVVITHDDRYFATADRIIKLDYGQIAFDKGWEAPISLETAAIAAADEE